MSRRQDYIARIRYQNDLPPPPCPPKLVQIPMDVAKLSSAGFLSNLVRKQPVNVDVDIDLGMPLDMIEVHGIFERGDESGVYPLGGASVDQLDPKDRALLRLPAGTASSKSQPGVSFLRRTEYISSELVGGMGASQSKSEVLRQQKLKDQRELLEPEAQLRIVESTFTASSEDLSKLKHPKRPGLTAVESWQFVPDAKMLDVTFLSVRMIGSASLKNTKREFSDDSLGTALFRRNVVEGDEWMSFYTAEDESAAELKRKLDSPEDTLEDDEQTYRFTRVQDNDIDLHLHRTPYEELAISLTEEGEARYIPIVGRTNLKRRRVLKQKREEFVQHSVDVVDLTLREITPRESIVRDNARSAYDPVTYITTELPDAEDEDGDKDEKEPEVDDDETE